MSPIYKLIIYFYSSFLIQVILPHRAYLTVLKGFVVVVFGEELLSFINAVKYSMMYRNTGIR